MPTTVVGTPSREMVRPTRDGSDAKRRFHRPSPMMATVALPGFSSSAVNSRPAMSLVPSTWVRAGLMWFPVSCSGSPVPVSVNVAKPTPASCSNDCVCSRQEIKFNTEALKLGRLSLSFFSATCMIRSDSAKGRDRIITAFTTVKMVALAAIAIATVRTTVTVNRGARHMIRTA